MKRIEKLPDLGGRYNKHEGIVMPPGYKAISHVQAQKRSYKRRPVRYSTFTGQAYAFDPNNPILLNLLDLSRKDTKALRQALAQVFRDRKLPFYNGDRNLGEKRRVEFLIRPPYFETLERERNANNRLQGSITRDEFVLHFDQFANLQIIRCFYPGLMMHHTVFEIRKLIQENLTAEKVFLQQHYGSWHQFALRLAFVTEQAFEQVAVARKWDWHKDL